MGVQGLLPLLKSVQRSSHLKDFATKTIGVDAYGWLHRGAVACAIDLATNKPTTKHIDFAMHRVRMLIHFGVTPYIVFDGDRLPSKSATEDGRAQRREDSRRYGLELLRMNKIAEAHAELQKSVDITPEMARELIEELKRRQVKYVVAPYEADAQLVYLEKQSLIDAILSEDSDMLIFGAQTLLTKLDKYGECTEIRAREFASCKEVSLVGWSLVELRRMAILSGCDYLEGIPKMGLKTAHRFVRKCKTIERTIQCLQLEGKFRVPPGYLAQYDQAEKTFLYQLVYCPLAQTLVPLTTLAKHLEFEDLPYIGKPTDPVVARGVAEGDLHPMTKLPILVKQSFKPAVSPFRPRIPRETVESINSNKKIESFFKPARTPLAELDPNNLSYSPSQWNTLLQNSGRSWAPEQAPANGTHSGRGTIVSAMNGTTGNVPTRQPSSSRLPQPLKRQKLCADEIMHTPLSNAETKSRFFTSVEPSPSVVAAMTRKKRSKRAEIELWSDDSIEQAMGELADFDTPAPSKLQDLKLPVPKLFVFKDAMNNEAPIVHQSAVVSPLVEEECITTVFTAGSLKEERTFRERFAFRKTDRPASDQEAGEVEARDSLITPPPTAKTGLKASSKTSSSSPAVLETPRPIGKPGSPTLLQKQPLPPLRLDPQPHNNISADGASSLVDGTLSWSSNDLGIGVGMYMGKGSEDLIVPDSDEGSDANSISDGPASCRGAGDNEVASERESRTLDLGRFAFTAARHMDAAA